MRNSERVSGHLHPVLEVLREHGLLSAEAAEAASREGALCPDAAVLSAGNCGQVEVVRALGELVGLDVFSSFDDVTFSREFVQKVPVEFARELAVVGLEGPDDELLLASGTALQPEVADAVAVALGRPVRVVLAPPSQIGDAITNCYQEGAELEWQGPEEPEQGEVMRVLDAANTEGDLLATVESAPVVELVNKLLFEALQSRASDVHLQPAAEELVVRYRIDGVLHSVATYPPAILEPVVSRIKVMARMDITEKRLPQDGRTTVRLGNKRVDLRISTVPSDYGERVVVRLLDRAAGVFGLEELGMSPHHLEAMDRIAHRDSGLFFCTGPTGSGKTTTLYAALSRVDNAERNIITLEDPIEYHLPGITQLPAGEKKGMSFASGLRSILRQDPDVIMVGEVRDVETARMAVRAAQTGHLVLSTLHTNDSAGAVARLLDLDVEPFLLASVLRAVLAQRLVRTVCPDCAEPRQPEPEELRRLTPEQPEADARFRRGSGCEHCLQTGYYGRTGLFELLMVDGPIRELVKERASAGAIREQADRAGVATLREDGIAKATSGITTVEEVLRVTQDEV